MAKPKFSPEDIEYYKKNFGFDPTEVKCDSSGDCNTYTYEHCFNLKRDPELKEAGIRVCAVTIVSGGVAKNRMKFVNTKNGNNASVECIHTAIATVPLEEAMRYASGGKPYEGVTSTENRAAVLPAVEHFAALKSYVAGLAELGIKNGLLLSYESGSPADQPWGMNGMMQSQIMKSLGAVAPDVTSEFSEGILKIIVRDADPTWVSRRIDLFDDMFHLRQHACKSIEIFDILSRTNQGIAQQCANELSKYAASGDVGNYLKAARVVLRDRSGKLTTVADTLRPLLASPTPSIAAVPAAILSRLLYNQPAEAIEAGKVLFGSDKIKSNSDVAREMAKSQDDNLRNGAAAFVRRLLGSEGISLQSAIEIASAIPPSQTETTDEPNKVISNVYKAGGRSIRDEIARSGKAPDWALRSAAELKKIIGKLPTDDKVNYIRGNLASAGSPRSDMLLLLAGDNTPSVREELAESKNLTHDVAMKLVASSGTSGDVLDSLLGNESVLKYPDVVAAAIRNNSNRASSIIMVESLPEHPDVLVAIIEASDQTLREYFYGRFSDNIPAAKRSDILAKWPELAAAPEEYKAFVEQTRKRG